MLRSVSLLLVMLQLCSLPGGSASGEDWPQFLGLRGTGVSGETDLVLDWTRAAPTALWKQPVGTGYSAPSIRSGRLVLHHRIGDEEVISCRNVQDGAEIWKQSYASSYSDPYGYNNGPRCSPVLTADHCFTLGAEGMLTCVSLADGRIIWQNNLKTQFQLPEWFFGMGCSPLLDGDRLIVLVGGQPDSGVVAFSPADGKVLWQAVGQQTWDGAETDVPGEPYSWTGDEMVVSYASPIIAEIHGQRQLLCFMRQGLVALNPETGTENFHVWFRPRVHESVNAAVPVVADNQVFLTAAYQLGSTLLQVDQSGRSTSPVWRSRTNMLAHWSTPIHADGYLYGFSGRHENEGELRCVRLSDGEVVWQTDGFSGDTKDIARDRKTGRLINVRTGQSVPYPYFGRGSLIQVGNRFIVLGERGTLSVVDVSPAEFIERGRTSFDEIHYPAWAAPVLSDGRLLLRSEDWLICLDLRKSP